MPEAAVHEADLGIRAVTAPDVEKFKADGVIVIRNFLGKAAMRAVADDLAVRVKLLERHHGIATADPHLDLPSLSRRIVRLDREAPGTQSVLYDAMSRSPALHSAGCNPALVDLVSNFVPGPVAHTDRFILLMSMPQGTWHLAGWHQDWYYNEGPSDTLTLYAPLQRTDAENGMLRFALGAHRDGLMPHGEYMGEFRTKWHTIDPAYVQRFDRIGTPVLESGDIVLFDSMVPHSAQVNTSEAIRFVLNLRYHGLDDPAFTEAGWWVGPVDHARHALGRKEKETV